MKYVNFVNRVFNVSDPFEVELVLLAGVYSSYGWDGSFTVNDINGDMALLRMEILII